MNHVGLITPNDGVAAHVSEPIVSNRRPMTIPAEVTSPEDRSLSATTANHPHQTMSIAHPERSA